MTIKPKATVICDLQFGSTGKGLIAGFLAKRDKPDVVMTAWSANAGHTYIDEDGRKFVHCMLANGIVSPNLAYVLIGPGSQMSLELLHKEVTECKDILKGKHIFIHRNAAIIQERHYAEENAEGGAMTKIGSTKKGCGAAMIDKIRRNPDLPITAWQLRGEIHDMFIDLQKQGVDVAVVGDVDYNAIVYGAQRIQVEGAQGFSLGINNGFYPYCTSRECTPAQIAVDCNLPLKFIDKVVGTMRTYPIRVANRFDESGKQIGTSGPCYSDQLELDWEKDLHRPAELTTVTKLPRRIFTFSEEQTMAALAIVRPDEIFLNFINYADEIDEMEGNSAMDTRDNIIDTIESVAFQLGIVDHTHNAGYYVRYLGYGPTQNDVEQFGTN